MAAAGLNFLNVLGDRQCGRQARENMHVVVHAADPIEVTVQVVMNSPNVFVEGISLAVRQGPLAILRRKYDVKQELRVGVRHDGQQVFCIAATRLLGILS